MRYRNNKGKPYLYMKLQNLDQIIIGNNIFHTNKLIGTVILFVSKNCVKKLPWTDGNWTGKYTVRWDTR